MNELYYRAPFLNTWPWFDFKVFELILLKNRSKDFFADFLSAFSGGWGIIINHKNHSILSLNYTEGTLNSAPTPKTPSRDFHVFVLSKEVSVSGVLISSYAANLPVCQCHVIER